MHSHLPASLNLRTCYARRPTQARPRQGRALPTVAARCNMQRSQQLTTSPHSTQSCKGLSTPSASVLLTTLAAPLPSMADEAAKVDNAALEAAQQYSTVTFGGSFGQWDPVIAVFFYLVVGSLTVLTLGVLYLSIRNWQDSTDEKKERARFSKSSQDRELVDVSAKARSRRSPPKRKNTGGGKGFGS